MGFKKKDTEEGKKEVITDDILKEIIKTALVACRIKPNIFETKTVFIAPQDFIYNINNAILVKFRSTGILPNRKIPFVTYKSRVYPQPELIVNDVRNYIAKYYPSLMDLSTYLVEVE
jgi:hypothetical protein